MNRTRSLLALMVLAIVLPLMTYPVVLAQDDVYDDGYYDDGSYYEEPALDDQLYYEDEPVYDDSSYYGEDAGEGESWVWDEDHPLENADLSWLPHTPYRPLDFSPFTEALTKISPSRMNELDAMIVEADVVQLEAMMEAGKLTSQELVLFYIDRIMKYDAGQLNSITQLNPDALYLAHLRDIQRTNGERKGPLQGIPVLLKENIATGDSMATTAGAIALADSPAERDARLVEQLRDAGAVILGKTNMTEWANWMHLSIANGYSAFGGQTLSPYGIDPSGSSTGNAVAITSNFAALAIGTETTGSIISPSSQASIVGMHPTVGLISGDNIIPLSPLLDTAGPMGKTVTDIALTMTIFAGAIDTNDPRARTASSVSGVDFMAALDPHALEGVRLGLLTYDTSLSEADVWAIYDATGALTAMAAAGASFEVVYLPEFPEGDWWNFLTCGMRDGIDRYLAQNDLTDPGSLADIIAFNDSDPDQYVPLGQARLEAAQWCEATDAEVTADVDDSVAMSRAYLDDLFANYDLDALVTLDDQFAYEYGVAGYPAITVPRGGYNDSTPTAFTFVGPICSDATLVGYAYAFEQTGPYRIPPELHVDFVPDSTASASS